MHIYLSCSKTMTRPEQSSSLSPTYPLFGDIAGKIAFDMDSYSVPDIQKMLKIKYNRALITKTQFQQVITGNGAAETLLSYTGTAYKELRATDFSSIELNRCNSHLLIGSFLYGLLRPSDLINNYRLEGNVQLECTKGKSLFDFWKPILTPEFIKIVTADDGILVNLASQELQNILDWNEIESKLTVITPQFKVDYGKAEPVTVSLYAKMCRGAMTRYIVKNNIKNPHELKGFEFQGFHWVNDWLFLLEA